MPAPLQSLSALPPGTVGVVAEVRLPPVSRARLMELGLVIGTPVERVRAALLGDPVEIKVRGSHLAVPRLEAEQILVQLPGGA